MFSHPWQREARAIVDQSRVLNAQNQLVLAYQFERARASHPDGFTMDVDGRLYEASEGYAVGVHPESFENVADALDTMARLQEVMGFRNLYLGYWRDDRTGRTYIDVTMVTHSFETAMRLGRTMEQVAIWDFQFSRAVDVQDDRYLEGMRAA
jgi:hypothetical protein